MSIFSKPPTAHFPTFSSRIVLTALLLTSLGAVAAGGETMDQAGARAFTDNQPYQAFLSKDGNPCVNVSFTAPVYGTLSGGWAPSVVSSRSQFLVADYYRNSVLAIDGQGRVSAWGKSSAISNPFKIRTFDGVSIIENRDSGSLISLEPWPSKRLGRATEALDLKLNGVQLKQAAGGSGQNGIQAGQDLGTIQGIFDWTPIPFPTDESEPAILAHADLLKPDGETYVSAFITLSQDGQGSVVKEYPLDHPLPFRVSYFEFPYLTTVGDKAYALFLEDSPWVGEISFGDTQARALDSVPADLLLVSDYERDEARQLAGDGMALATESLHAFEDSDSVAGLYGYDGHLFVLFKEGMNLQDSSTDWWLHEISTANGKQVVSVKGGDRKVVYGVPSDAAQLIAVPGEVWGFIEKSPVTSLQPMGAPFVDISSATWVPFDNFSKLNGRGPESCSRIASGR